MQPSAELTLAKDVRRQLLHCLNSIDWVRSYGPTIQSQKSGCGDKSGALVPIDKGMGLADPIGICGGAMHKLTLLICKFVSRPFAGAFQ